MATGGYLRKLWARGFAVMCVIGAAALMYWLIDSYHRMERPRWTVAAVAVLVVFAVGALSFILERRATALEERAAAQRQQGQPGSRGS
jgi:uncharacterized membrane protein (DUF4010 family)